MLVICWWEVSVRSWRWLFECLQLRRGRRGTPGGVCDVARPTLPVWRPGEVGGDSWQSCDSRVGIM